MGLKLGIDLGGTSAKVAVVRPPNRILREQSVLTGGTSNPKAIVKHIARVARNLVGNRRIESAGVGVAGDIDSQNGVVRVSPNLRWKNVPLKSLFQKSLRCPVRVDNDANVAAWGLYNTQTPKYVKNIIVFTLGTGVGGGIVLNGGLHRGTTGSAGEVGHMLMRENGRQCNCGNRGCLEAYAGGSYMSRFVKRDLKRGQASSLRSIFKENPHKITPKTISQAALRGDPYALSVWKEAGTVLGNAMGNLIYVLNPEFIFLTGGVAQARGLLLKPIWATLKTRTFKTPVAAVTIKIAENASHAGVIGASLLE